MKIVRLMPGTLLILLLININSPATSLASDFFNQRYRGWIWFEEKERQEEKKGQKQNQQEEEQQQGQEEEEEEEEFDGNKIRRSLTREELEQARRENEQYKEELELLKHAMIRYPGNVEHIRRYKEKEKIMLDNSMLLSKNFLLTNFLYPDIADNLENPQNLYGRNAKKQMEKARNKQRLELVASKVELFVFLQGNCPHCEYLEKHLASFANTYGFKVEAISSDGMVSKYFKTHSNKEQVAELIRLLDLRQMPTVIAVTNDSSLRFELARGAVSIPELEESALMMEEYLANNMSNQHNTNKANQANKVNYISNISSEGR